MRRKSNCDGPKMPERRVCPDEFQEAINERFGLNRFGGPKYRIVWSETETITVQGRNGYEQRLLCKSFPCWNILRWRAPECYGTPQLYDLVNRDPVTHLCVLGEYPFEGAWEVVKPLMNTEFHRATGLVTDVFELDYMIVDTLLPILEMCEEMSEAEIAASEEYIAAQENKAVVDEITDRLLEELPTRYGPVSYGRGGCKTSVIDKKMAQISDVWNRMSRTALRRPRKGFYQGQN